MAAAFSRLRLVAEQYPQLMLSQNLEQFATAIIQIEAEIARRTVAYNDAVNRYGTALQTYPVCVIGRIMRFEGREYYRPDAESMRFRRVEY